MASVTVDPVTQETAAEIEELYADRIVDEQLVQWSARDGAVLARRRRRQGAHALEA